EEINMIGNFIWGVTEKGIFDSEHDLYQANFMGHTCRFYIKMLHTGLLRIERLDNNNNLAIELNYTYDNDELINKYNFIGFTIYDDKGYQYIFTEKEITTENKVSQTTAFNGSEIETFHDPLIYFSSFHLSEIKDNNNETIVSFFYQDSYEDYSTFNTMHVQTVPWTNGSMIKHWLDHPVDYGTVHGIMPITVKTRAKTSISTKKIENIEIKNKARISFVLEKG